MVLDWKRLECRVSWLWFEHLPLRRYFTLGELSKIIQTDIFMIFSLRQVKLKQNFGEPSKPSPRKLTKKLKNTMKNGNLLLGFEPTTFLNVAWRCTAAPIARVRYNSFIVLNRRIAITCCTTYITNYVITTYICINACVRIKQCCKISIQFNLDFYSIFFTQTK